MTDPVMLLSQVYGEGRVTFRALRAAGFYTLAGVAEASVHMLSERAHLSVQTARRLKAGAEEMLGKGLGALEQDETQRTVTQRTGSPRSPRFSQKEAGEPDTRPSSITFSAGITLQEALLLSDTWETTPEPFFTTAAVPNPAPAPMPAPVTRIPVMAAAAEVAASLTRVPAVDRPSVPPEPQADTRAKDRTEPRPITRAPGETFWSFG